MNLYEQRAITMIEGELARIGNSAFPSDETLNGFIEANYAYGFISEAQQRDFQQRGANLLLYRRMTLASPPGPRRLQTLASLYGGETFENTHR